MSCVRLFVLIAAVALSGCGNSGPPTGQARADAATQSACRQRADQVYNQQNRGQIYSPASQVNTPFSANYVPDQTDRRTRRTARAAPIRTETVWTEPVWQSLTQ